MTASSSAVPVPPPPPSTTPPPPMLSSACTSTAPLLSPAYPSPRMTSRSTSTPTSSAGESSTAEYGRFGHIRCGSRSLENPPPAENYMKQDIPNVLGCLE
ncbi:hypothetical protein ACOSP7_001619 [Xanthoceras sorbifolium]